MKKRIFLHILAVLLLVAALAPGAAAAEKNIASGTCGEGISWSLDGYTLTISGSGEMEDGAPWEEHKNHIEHVVLTDGVTRIGAKAFYKYDRIETVDFGDDLVEIGDKAFYGCDDIDYIHLPATFRTFGAEAFRDCFSLKYVYCDGGMPRFNDSCLWTGNYISVFYPTNNPWPAGSVNQLVHNFGGRLGIMMGNFDESVVAENLKALEPTEETEETEETTEATTAPTEAETEPAAEPTVAVIATEPETEPTTEATTEPTTEPATEATTQPTTVPTEAVEIVETEFTLEFEEDTQPQTIEEQVESNGWIGMVLVAGVLTFLIVGALIFRVASRKGRYKK